MTTKALHLTLLIVACLLHFTLARMNAWISPSSSYGKAVDPVLSNEYVSHSRLFCLQWTSCGTEQCGFVRCKKRPNGYGCVHSSECMSGKCFQRDVCITPGRGYIKNNEQCYDSSDCASGNCNYGYCDDQKTVGHACHQDSGCISSNCWNGHCQQAGYRPE